MGRKFVDICPICKKREKGYTKGGRKRGYCLQCQREDYRKRTGSISRKERYPEATKGVCFKCKKAPRENGSYCRKCSNIVTHGNPPRYKRGFWNNPLYGELAGRKKRQAAKRGLEFKLSQSEFQDLIESDCFYCGSPPNQVSKGVVYQGIDRVDSTKGYVPGNVVPCCKFCNWGKNTLSQKEFFDHVLKIAKHSGLIKG